MKTNFLHSMGKTILETPQIISKRKSEPVFVKEVIAYAPNDN